MFQIVSRNVLWRVTVFRFDSCLSRALSGNANNKRFNEMARYMPHGSLMWPISLQEKKLRPKVFVRKWRALMRIRVLLVDDEEQFVDLLSQRLKARNFEVLTALGGDEGLSVLDKVDIDVAVLDVMMPGRDGLSMLQEFKRTRPLTEVIMLTGNTTVETAISGMKLGAFDYLLKPVDMSILIDKLTSASQRKKEHEDRIRNAEVERIVKTKGY